MSKIIFCILIFFATDPLSINEIQGSIIAVHDGNTLEFLTGANENYRLVLEGIDCPELTQEYGVRAKKYLENLVLHKKVIVHLQGKDPLRNYIAVVLLEDKTDIRIPLLKEGLAWTSEKSPLPELEFHRSVAAENKQGLWKQDAPTPPWIYRRQQSMSKPKSR